MHYGVISHMVQECSNLSSGMSLVDDGNWKYLKWFKAHQAFLLLSRGPSNPGTRNGPDVLSRSVNTSWDDSLWVIH